MIGSLKGFTQVFNTNAVLLTVGGVGYKVFVNAKLLEFVVKEEEEIFLYIHTNVKEDALDLYGFRTREELALFELLIEVSGIGPKTALVILDRTEEEIKQAIISSDVDFFTNIPRIGKKNAQRIIIDLKSKLGSLTELDLSGKTGGQTQEVIEALAAMGFRRFEVVEVLSQLPKELVTTEDKVREALKRLGGKL